MKDSTNVVVAENTAVGSDRPLEINSGCATEAGGAAGTAATIAGEDDVLGRLSERQLQAVELIVAGRGDEQVAGELRVHRVTVTRWRLYHAGFRAALGRRRQETWGSSADRFRSLLGRAVDVVEQGLFSEDPSQQARAARTVLGLASRGRFCPPGEPQSTPEVIEELARTHRRQRLASDPADQTLELEDYHAAAMELEQRHDAFRKKEGG